MPSIQEIIDNINLLESKANNKGWTLNNVFQSIIDAIPSLANTNDTFYKCIRTAIIETISSSYESNLTEQEKVYKMLVYIVDCKKKYKTI